MLIITVFADKFVALMFPEAADVFYFIYYNISLLSYQMSQMEIDGIEIVREIGHGSYGTVWLVKRTDSQKNLVLKCVSSTYLYLPVVFVCIDPHST